jgi:hypothetical protein
MRLSSSGDSLSRYLVQGRAELHLVSTLFGGNESNSNPPHGYPTNLSPVANIGSLPQAPANLPGVPSDSSSVAAAPGTTVPENNGSAYDSRVLYVPLQ